MRCKHTWRDTWLHTGIMQNSDGSWDNYSVAVEVCVDCLKVRNTGGKHERN